MKHVARAVLWYSAIALIWILGSVVTTHSEGPRAVGVDGGAVENLNCEASE